MSLGIKTVKTAFNSGVETAQKTLDNGMERLWDNKWVQRRLDDLGQEVVFFKNKNKKVTKFERWQNHQPAMFSALMGGFYAFNGLKSDKIPEDRKKFYAINCATFTGIGIAGGYVINHFMKKPIMNIAKNVLKNHPDEKVLMNGLKTAVPLLSFVITLRYLGPVISTPIAEALNKFLVKKNIIKSDKPVEFKQHEKHFLGCNKLKNDSAKASFKGFLEKHDKTNHFNLTV